VASTTPELVCQRCGAPLTVTPETIVAICEYCGYPRILGSTINPDEVFIVESIGRDAAVSAFWKAVEADRDLRRLRNKIDLLEVEGFYVPAWIGRVMVDGVVEYIVRERRDNREYKRLVREDISFQSGIGFCARRAAATFGITDAIYYFLKTRERAKSQPLTEFPQEKWERVKLKVLNTEVDVSEVRERMCEDVADIVRSNYAHREVTYFRVYASLTEQPKLYLIPVWLAYYRYGEGTFRMALAGWDGARVAASEPVTGLHRALYTLGVFGLIAISSFLGGVIAYNLRIGESISVPAAIFTFLTIAAPFLSYLIVKGARVERLYRKRVQAARGTVIERTK